VSPDWTPSRVSESLDQAFIALLALALFVVPLLTWPGLGDPTIPKTSALLIAIFLLTVVWGVRLWKRDSGPVQLPWILLPVVILGLAALLSLLAAVDRHESLHSLIVGALHIQLLVMIATTVRSERETHLLLGSLLSAGVLAGLYGLLQHLGVASSSVETFTQARMVSTFGQVNYLGGFVAYLIFPSATLLLTGGKLVKRMVALFASLFMIAMLVVVNQMGTLLGLLAGSFVALVVGSIGLGKGRRAPRRLLIFFVCIAVFATATATWRSLPSPSAGEPTPTGDEPSILSFQPLQGNAIDERLLFWTAGLRMLAEHPITGVGLGNYRSLYTPYEVKVRASHKGSRFDSVSRRTEVAHNDYIQIAAELGIGGVVGVVAFLAVFVWALWTRVRRDTREWTHRTSGFLLLSAGIVTILAHALVSFPMVIPSSRLVMVGLLGLLFCPYFGEHGSLTLVLPHPARRAMVVLLVLLSSIGAVLAARDLGGFLLFARGREQLLLGDSAMAVETLSRSVSLSFSPKCAVYYLGMAQAQSGKYENAFSSFERCLACCPADRVYFFYADLASQLGKIEAARAAISTLLATVPSAELATPARILQAQIERRAGDSTAAIALLQEFLESEPSCWEAQAELGRMHLEDGREIDAHEHYQAALAQLDVEIEELEGDLFSASALGSNARAALLSKLRALESERNRIRRTLHNLAELDG